MNGLQITELIAIGLFAGLAGGMLGVGGSLVMIPAMTEILGPNQHLYQAAAMIVNFFVAAPAYRQHRLADAVHTGTVRRLLPLALVGITCGVLISELPFFHGDGEAYLRGLFGLFLLSICAYDLSRLLRRTTVGDYSVAPAAPVVSASTLSWKRAAAIALPTGLVAGVLGIGGGVLAIPLQLRLLRISIRAAIANSAAIILVTSAVGATIKNYAYFIQHERSLEAFSLALVLIPTAIVGSHIGSRLTHRLPLRWVKTAFYILLALASARLAYQAGQALWADVNGGEPVVMIDGESDA